MEQVKCERLQEVLPHGRSRASSKLNLWSETHITCKSAGWLGCSVLYHRWRPAGHYCHAPD